jgi:hypothetical protein
VRDDNLERSYSMIEQSLTGGFVDEAGVGEDEWEEAKKDGMNEKKSRKSR